MQRGTVLTEAISVINGERQDTYGNPEDSFEVISAYWSTYLKSKLKPGEKLEPKDSVIMMVLFKVAREQNQGKRDNLVDAAGYIGIAGDMAVMADVASAKESIQITAAKHIRDLGSICRDK